MENILKNMSMLSMYREYSFHTFLHRDVEKKVKNIDYLIISAYSSELIEKEIRSLKMLGNSVEYLLIGGNRI